MPPTQLQAKVQTMSQADHSQLHSLVLQFCQRVGACAEEAAPPELLQSAGDETGGIHVCSVSEQETGRVRCCAIFYPTYSSWVGVCLRVGLLHCDSDLLDSCALKLLTDNLAETALQWGAANVELQYPAAGCCVCERLARLGFRNMTLDDRLHTARLSRDGLQLLANRQLADGVFLNCLPDGVSPGRRDAVLVRPAVAADAGAVMKMMLDLAEFVNMSDQVQIGAEQLERDCFRRSESSLPAEFRLFVAETAADRQAVGYSLVFPEFTHLGRGSCIEDVYVESSFRGRGVGGAFFKAAAQLTEANGGSFMTLCFLNWNTPASDIYRRYGFEDVTAGQPGLQYFTLTAAAYVANL